MLRGFSKDEKLCALQWSVRPNSDLLVAYNAALSIYRLGTTVDAQKFFKFATLFAEETISSPRNDFLLSGINWARYIHDNRSQAGGSSLNGESTNKVISLTEQALRSGFIGIFQVTDSFMSASCVDATKYTHVIHYTDKATVRFELDERRRGSSLTEFTLGNVDFLYLKNQIGRAGVSLKMTSESKKYSVAHYTLTG